MADITANGMNQKDLHTFLSNVVTIVNSIRTQLAGVIDATLVWDPASLVDAAGESSSLITATGAALGDYVIVAPPADMEDILATGYVQAADKVQIRIQNEGAATVDLASGTWKVKVIPSTSLASLSESALTLSGL